GLRDHVVVDERGAGSRHHRDTDAGKGVANDVAGDRDVAQIFAPAGDDAERGRILDHIAGDGAVRLDIDADAGVVVRRGPDRPPGQEVADDVALHDRKTATFIEVADGDADRRAVDGIAGDHGAFERKLRIERDLAHVADAVADDLDVRGRVAAHRGIVAIFDPVAPDDDIAGAKRVDGVAILP